MDTAEFAAEHAVTDSDRTFQLETDYTLDVAVDDSVLVKAGSMIGYTGDLTFTGKATAEGGLTGFVKEAMTNEGTPIMKAEGHGHVYLADQGKKVQLVDLGDGEGLSVNGDDVLAFESAIDYEIDTVGGVSEAVAGGLTNVYLRGPGTVALTTHGDPIVLTPPVTTDPDATVAWSTTLSPSVATNKTFEIGQTSEEGIQMQFTGDEGFVVVQPYEEGGGA